MLTGLRLEGHLAAGFHAQGSLRLERRQHYDLAVSREVLHEVGRLVVARQELMQPCARYKVCIQQQQHLRIKEKLSMRRTLAPQIANERSAES